MENNTKKNLLIFGDSYSTFMDHIPQGYLPYYSEHESDRTDVRKVGQTWWHRLCTDMSFELVLNDSWSGTTLCNTGYSGDCSKTSSFIFRLNRLIDEGFFADNRIDTVLIFGCTNDSWADAPLGELKFDGFEDGELFSVLPAIGYFAARLKEILPDADIVFIVNTELKPEIGDAMEKTAEHFGIGCVKLENVDKSCGHPTVKGMGDIKEQVEAYLLSMAANKSAACRIEGLRGLLDPTHEITELEIIGGGGLPTVCRVIVESHPSASSLIRSVVWMPDNWNGILVGLGNGGIAGQLGGSFWDYAKQGYATVQTDMGTSLVRSGERTTADADLWKDYTWRSTHIMTETAKKLICGYYGRMPDYSYFIGASAGGLQAFSEAQRFPQDYDGIIAGVPSNNALNLIVYFLWLHINLHDRDGKGLISKEEAGEISLYAAEYFNMRGDGEKGDDFVTYPYTDENTVEDFLAFLSEKAPKFTPEQLSILRTIYNGPKNPKTGEQIFCGLPIGAERNSGYFGDNSGKFGYPWLRLFFGEDFDDRDFDFADDYEKLLETIGDDFTANNADLRALKDNGSKFLVYSGASDPAGPFADAVKYYNRVCGVYAKLGGFEKVSEFFRFFILPGKAHGDTGLGVNRTWGDESRTSLLETMRLWREKGKAPETLTGAHIDTEDGKEIIKFIRTVYPYKADKKEGSEFPRTSSDRILGHN